MQPELDNILTDEEVGKAKEEFLKRIEEISFKNDEEKHLAKKWIESEQTIFGLGDIEPLLKTMAMSQLPDINEQDKN